jgi:hypothetical protein
MPKPKTPGKMDLPTFYKRVESDKALVKTLRGVDQQLCASYGDVLTRLFREIVAQEHRNVAQFRALKDAYSVAAHGAMRLLDQKGITAAVSRVAPLLLQVSFKDSAAMLTYEAASFHRMGVPYSKITPFWAFLDRNKASFIRRTQTRRFSFESLVNPAVASFGKERGGEAWEHLSPGFWRRMVGFAVAVVNLTAEIPTVGLSTVSVIAGGIGVAAG